MEIFKRNTILIHFLQSKIAYFLFNFAGLTNDYNFLFFDFGSIGVYVHATFVSEPVDLLHSWQLVYQNDRL